jgi:hypothetical protein
MSVSLILSILLLNIVNLNTFDTQIYEQGNAVGLQVEKFSLVSFLIDFAIDSQIKSVYASIADNMVLTMESPEEQESQSSDTEESKGSDGEEESSNELQERSPLQDEDISGQSFDQNAPNENPPPLSQNNRQTPDDADIQTPDDADIQTPDDADEFRTPDDADEFRTPDDADEFRTPDDADEFDGSPGGMPTPDDPPLPTPDNPPPAPDVPPPMDPFTQFIKFVQSLFGIK